ncbi:PREDICTED: uncharacterized protein LOC109177803 [Ipomoea nil]|uniref:uncharacterized protein LOC109177803 n=1 Tax=Ipomoea nil TaxID=35883 RepID=UPI000900C88D|nr:PREDICTED: uncharacterized protein LOC109177803 [Ipomoea nil]
MYNNHSSSDHNKPLGAAPPIMSPRISFSNDFVESSNGGAAAHHHYQQLIKNYRDAPVSSDFEFCVSNYSAMTMSADELFSKGRLLPYKETGAAAAAPNHHKTTTLKDELLVEDDDVSLKPPKSPTRWKGLLGLRKSHIGSKKVDKNSEDKRDEVLATKNSSRDALHGGGSSSCRDMEFRFN